MDQATNMYLIYYQLLGELSDLSDQFETAQLQAQNTQLEGAWADVVRSHARGNNTALDAASAFKNRMINVYQRNIENNDLIVDPMQTANLEIELEQRLLEKVTAERQLIDEMESELSGISKVNEDLERLSNDLQQMVAKFQERCDVDTKTDWLELTRRVKAKRSKTIKDFNVVLNQLFSNSQVDEILQAALNSYMSDEESYIESSSFALHDVEFLLRSGLLIRHPHDKNLIRLSDFL